VQLPSLRYPADAAIAKTSAISLGEHACKAGRPVSGTAQLRDISLVGGSVRATSITLTVGANVSAAVVGLAVNGTPTHARRVSLQSWGYVLVGSQPPVRMADGSEAVAALSIHLLQAHDGLPAGTTILAGFIRRHVRSAATTKAAGKRRARATSHPRKKPARATHEPLTVTPPLGQRRFVFPVAGTADYGDSYGGFRGDVPGNWHHGDDIFATLGTPVVAVADGTINRVGWEKLGGWRLWVRDGAGDEFYYAHLSGYAPSDLRSNRVKAGQVIGFIGNTGDAFTTAPHLHFEVHPRTLLHLGYDGAVDPTTYLEGWTRLEHVDAPRPTHPALPVEPQLRKEARYVFRELLAARHLIKHAPRPSRRPHVAIPPDATDRPVAASAPIREAAPLTVVRSGMSDLTFALLLGLVSFLLTGAILAVIPLRARLFRPRDPV